MKMHSRNAHLCTSVLEVDSHPGTRAVEDEGPWWAISVLSQGLMLQWRRDAECSVWCGSRLLLQPYWSAFPPSPCLLSCSVPLNILSPRVPLISSHRTLWESPSQHRGHHMVIVTLFTVLSFHGTVNSFESRSCISFISESSETSTIPVSTLALSESIFKRLMNGK